MKKRLFVVGFLFLLLYASVSFADSDVPADNFFDENLDEFGDFLTGRTADEGNSLIISIDSLYETRKIEDSAKLRPEKLTISAWVKADELEWWDSFAIKSNTAWSNGYGFYHRDGFIHFFVNDYKNSVSSPFFDGKWYHVVGIYDEKSIKLYVNGKLFHEKAYNNKLNHDASSLLLAYGRGKSDTFTWKGGIKGFNFWNYALSEATVKKLYNELPEDVKITGPVLKVSDVDEVFSLPDFSSFKPKKLTVYAKVKADSLGEWNSFLMKSDEKWTEGYGFYYRNDKIHFFINDWRNSVSADIGVDKAYEIIGTYNKNVMKLYIDGMLVDSKFYSQPISYSEKNLLIGKGAGASGQYFWNGKILEIRIWNHEVFVPQNCVNDCKHPSLYFNNEELEKIREKSADNKLNNFGFKPHESFNRIKERVDGYLLNNYEYNVEHKCSSGTGTMDYFYRLSSQTPPYGTSPYATCNICCPWTQIGQSVASRLFDTVFVYAVTEDAKYLTTAKDLINYIGQWDRWSDIGSAGTSGLSGYEITRAMSFAYDVLYDKLSVLERIELRRAILEKGIKLIKRQIENEHNGVFIQNTHVHAATALGLAALTLEEDCVEEVTDVQLTCNKIIQDSLRLALKKTSEFIDNQPEDGSVYEGAAYGSYSIDKIIRFAVALKRAGKKDLFESTLMTKIWDDPIFLSESGQHIDFNDASTSLYWLEEAGFAASELQNPYAAWYVKRNGFEFDDAFSFIFLKDDTIPKIPYETSKAFIESGFAVLRSDWSENHPVLFFDSGPNNDDGKPAASVHTQFDDNTFSIMFEKDWLASDSGYFQVETYKHNTFLVDDQGQDDKFAGQITDFYDAESYGFIQGDASKSYSLLDKYQRNIFYVKPDHFVIVDELSASKPVKFSWLLHTNSKGEVKTNNIESSLGDVTVFQDHSILKGVVSASSELTTESGKHSLTSSTAVTGTRHVPFVSISTPKIESTRFVSLLFPVKTPIGVLQNRRFEEFDQGPAGWVKGGQIKSIDQDTNIKTEGSSSLSIAAKTIGKKARVYQDVFVTSGTQFQASVKIKGEVSKQAGFIIWWQNAEGDWFLEHHKSDLLNGKFDWKTLKLEGVVPEGAAKARVDLFLFGGKAWFDDVKFKSESAEQELEFNKLNPSTFEILRGDRLRIVSVNALESKQTSAGLFSCNARFCSIGYARGLNSLVMHEGTSIKLDDFLFESSVAARASFEISDSLMEGEINVKQPANFKMRVDGFKSIQVDGVNVQSTYNGQTLEFTLGRGQHKVVISLGRIYDQISVKLLPGWNMISSPFEDTVVEGCKARPAITYDPTLRNVDGSLGGYESWILLENIKDGVGYWVHAEEECISSFSGKPRSILELKKGWNMMAIPYSEIAIFDDECDVSTIYEFESNLQSYKKLPLDISALQKGRSYWVYSNNECTVSAT